jgi:hypothetical protein
MKSILIAILFILVSAPAFAGNENVEECKNLAAGLDCKAIFAPCVAMYNAQDRAAKKEAEWRAVCEFGLLEVSLCAATVGDENPEFCRCIADRAVCPGKAVGKCVANIAAEANADKHFQRFVDTLLNQCL